MCQIYETLIKDMKKQEHYIIRQIKNQRGIHAKKLLHINRTDIAFNA
jgi:hypothetical protein